MKRLTRLVACALSLTLLLSGVAFAETIYEGKVTGGSTESVLAPFGGIVEPGALRAGDRVQAGDVVANIRTTKVYASVEGVVSGVFGQEGDATESIVERYGATLFIEPTHKYTIAATTEKAYNTSENKFIHIGETVYLSCTADGTHRGTGVVVKVEAEKYTVEVTGGEFYMEETVGVFRAEDYASSSRIGRGTVAATAAVAIKGSGSILKMHVRNGDTVERGELLFETGDGVLDGLYSPGGSVVTDVTGIVSSVDAAPGSDVAKGGKLVTIYPDDVMQIEIQVPESDLASIHVGMRMQIEFSWDADRATLKEGEVTAISYVNTQSADGGAPTYTAYVSFVPDDTVRLGMTALVYPIETPAESIDNEEDTAQ